MGVRRTVTPSRPLPVRLALTGLTVSAIAFLVLPMLGLVSRSPWGRALELLGGPAGRSALLTSAIVSSSAVALSLLFGAPLAWLLARRHFPGRNVLRAIVTLPLVLPPVVAGVGMLAAFGHRGLLGTTLTWLGIQLPFTTAGAILAATFVSAPLLISSLEAGLAQLEKRYEEVAATLGARRVFTLVRVTLPALRPALIAGIATCWARALGEFGATIAFAGNLRGVTQTIPLAIYELLQVNPEEAFLLGCLLLIVALALFAVLGLRLPAR